MKRILCCILLVVVLSASAFAETAVPDEVQDILDAPPITAQEFSALSLFDLLDKGIETVKEQIQMPLKLLLQALGTALVGAVTMALVPDKQWQKTLEMLCLLALFTVGILPALDLVADISAAIHQWQVYLISFVPVFSGLMLSCGQITQAAVYSGMFLTMAGFSAQIICTMALPLVQVYIALHTASSLTGINGLSDGCELIYKCVRWILTGVTLLFSTVLGLQSILAGNADGLAMKTGQFLLSSGVPIVGSVASDAMGSVMSGLKVLKGTVGFAGVTVLAVDFVPLLVQSVGYQLAYALGGAAAKSFGLSKAGNTLQGMGQAIGLCVSFQVFFFMLVVITTALMIVTGGG